MLRKSTWAYRLYVWSITRQSDYNHAPNRAPNCWFKQTTRQLLEIPLVQKKNVHLKTKHQVYLYFSVSKTILSRLRALNIECIFTVSCLFEGWGIRLVEKNPRICAWIVFLWILNNRSNIWVGIKLDEAKICISILLIRFQVACYHGNSALEMYCLWLFWAVQSEHFSRQSQHNCTTATLSLSGFWQD